MREEFDFNFVLIGLGLVLALLWFTGNLRGEEKSTSNPEEEDDRETPWNLEEIRKYDGTGPEGKIYIGCNGFVFDVSKSENYRPGGDYANFAGHDISMACAYYSTDDKYLGQVYDPDTTVLKFSQ